MQHQEFLQHEGYKTGRNAGNNKTQTTAGTGENEGKYENTIGSVSKDTEQVNNIRDASIIEAIICTKDAF
jgi:hypothetical protein